MYQTLCLCNYSITIFTYYKNLITKNIRKKQLLKN